MKSHKSFDWYAMKQRFSFRKYHFGLASVFLGVLLSAGSGVVHAEESTLSANQIDTTIQVVTESTAITEESTLHENFPTSSADSLEEEVVATPVEPAETTPASASTPETSELLVTEESEEKTTKSVIKEEVPKAETSQENSTSVPIAPQVAPDIPQPVAAVATTNLETTAEQEHTVEIFDDFEKIVTTTVSADALRQLSPTEVYALTRYELSGFNMTREIFESLSPEQVRALTFSREYQAVTRGNNRRLRSAFRAADGEYAGYTITEPWSDKYPKDPVSGRFTYNVIENNGYYFTISADKPVLSGDELEKTPDIVYITPFDSNRVQLEDAIRVPIASDPVPYTNFVKYGNTQITVGG